jgi:hypothetical protein
MKTFPGARHRRGPSKHSIAIRCSTHFVRFFRPVTRWRNNSPPLIYLPIAAIGAAIHVHEYEAFMD